MARRKVAGRKVAEMMTPPQTGFPSLMKFTPLMRSETTSKMKSPRSGSKLLSTTKICLVRVYSPSTRILARVVKNCMPSQQGTLDGQAWTTTSRKKREINQSCKMSWIWRIYPCKKLEGWGKKSGRILSFAKSSIVLLLSPELAFCVNFVTSRC